MPRHNNDLTATGKKSLAYDYTKANMTDYLKAADLFVQSAKEQDPSRWGASKNRMMSLKVLIATLFMIEDFPERRNTGLLVSDVNHRCRELVRIINNTKQEYLTEHLPWYSKNPFVYPHAELDYQVFKHKTTEYDVSLLAVLRDYGLVGYVSGTLYTKKLILKAKDSDTFAECRKAMNWHISTVPSPTINSEVTESPDVKGRMRKQEPNLSVEDRLRLQVLGQTAPSAIKVTLEVEHYAKLNNVWMELKVDEYFEPRSTTAFFDPDTYAFRLKITVPNRDSFYLGNGIAIKKYCTSVVQEAVLKAITEHHSLPNLLLNESQLPRAVRVIGRSWDALR